MGGRGGSSGMRGSSSNPFPNSIVQETLYHGSVSPGITEFNTSGPASSGAIFFTDFEEQAMWEPDGKYWAKNPEPTLYEVKLDIRNPLRVDNRKTENDPSKEKRYIQQAKRQGHDSVIFFDPRTDITNYAVFSPKQVKIIKKSKIDDKMMFGF